MGGKDKAVGIGRSRRQIYAKIAAENNRLIENGTFMSGYIARRTQNQMIRRCKEVDILRLPDLQALRDGFWERHNPGCVLGDKGTDALRPYCEVTNEDCCSAARRLADRHKPLLMNFANPYQPGGGYLAGAAAQEESICRRTTLYASLSHPEAYEIYRFNQILHRPTDTGCMIWSPYVYIFRDSRLALSEDIVEIAVLSVPAPNRKGGAAKVNQEELDRVMCCRLENFFMKAIEEGYCSLVLGAWGCGAFGHDPERVAGYFWELLYEKGYAAFFKEIVFAVRDRSLEQNHFKSFCRRFADVAVIKE